MVVLGLQLLRLVEAARIPVLMLAVKEFEFFDYSLFLSGVLWVVLVDNCEDRLLLNS